MNFIVQTSLGILLMIVLIKADVNQGNIQFKKQCEVRRRKKLIIKNRNISIRYFDVI